MAKQMSKSELVQIIAEQHSGGLTRKDVKSVIEALATVGYKELFHYLDGKTSIEVAVAAIKTNTRQYAKRQLTWFHRDLSVRWTDPETPLETLI